MKLSVLHEGIKKAGAGFAFDWQRDDGDDIVHLHGEHRSVRTFKSSDITVYYGFVNSDSDIKGNKKDTMKDTFEIAKLLKNGSDPNVQIFIDEAAAEFVSFMKSASFVPDVITFPESSSNFNARFANTLHASCQAPVVNNGFEKLLVSQTTIDRGGIKDFKIKNLKDQMISNFRAYIEKNAQDIDAFAEMIGTGYNAEKLKQMCTDHIKQKVAKGREAVERADAIFNEIVSVCAEIWSETEIRKLEIALSQQKPNNKTKIKEFRSKDKRRFINFLKNNNNLVGAMQQIKDKRSESSEAKKIKMLVIDDNVDSGATFAVINRLNREDIEYLFYAPLRIKSNS